MMAKGMLSHNPKLPATGVPWRQARRGLPRRTGTIARAVAWLIRPNVGLFAPTLRRILRGMGLSLSRKVSIGLVCTLLPAGLGCGLALVWAIQSQKAAETVLADNLAQASAISDLKIALLEQDRLIGPYVLHPDPDAVTGIAGMGRRFDAQLEKVERIDWEPDQRLLIHPIGDAYDRYRADLTTILDLAGRGQTNAVAEALRNELPPRYGRVIDLCDRLNAANNRDIESSIRVRQTQTRRVGLLGALFLMLATGLVGVPFWLFVKSLLAPLQRMAAEATQHAAPDVLPAAGDELNTLGRYLDVLKADASQAKAHLAQTRNHLLDAEKLATVGRLAAGVAHEIRSPLTSLKLRLFSMQKALGGQPRYQTDIQTMSDEIARLDNIIRNFLEFSRPPAIQLSRHDVCLLLAKTVDLLRYKAEASRIQIDVAGAPGLPPALVDAQQLRQVFLNLIGNAIDAMPEGGTIRITVELDPTPDAPRAIRMCIRDTGTGVPAAVRDRIFDPFFSTKEEGAGLGLWIAQRIVMEHGGRLDLGESDARGTTFTLHIPVDRETTHE